MGRSPNNQAAVDFEPTAALRVNPRKNFVLPEKSQTVEFFTKMTASGISFASARSVAVWLAVMSGLRVARKFYEARLVPKASLPADGLRAMKCLDPEDQGLNGPNATKSAKLTMQQHGPHAE